MANTTTTTKKSEASTTMLALLVAGWYLLNTFYNIYNKRAANMIHAHWFLALSQLVVGIFWSISLWVSGARKVPNLTGSEIAACIPIGLFACLAHGGSVLSAAVGAVSFQQIVKACEPVFAAIVGVIIPPPDVKPPLAYAMLCVIVAGVGLACIKEGKGIDINMEAFWWASLANAAAALKGKFGSSITKALEHDPSKNMDAANVYAVMNIISAICTIPMVVISELPTLSEEWNHAVEKHGMQPLLMNIFLSGACFYLYNEFAFAFTSHVGAVTSSVLNTAKRVIIIVVSSIIFLEPMERNTVLGSAIAIGGTFAYSMTSKKKEAPKAKTS